MAITNKMLQISNKSYINKDFQTIYPELIEWFNQLTNAYDPSASNESDPMVVLLKLSAALGDKLSYNNDKTGLETALPSATQETSVREITEVNGYNMHYYISASTPVSIMYGGDVSTDNKLVFKAFETQLTNDNGSIIYTLIDDIEITEKNKMKSGYATQGVPHILEINGNSNIQLSNLDANNRLYFPVPMVAQNRVYVKRDSDNNWTTWKNVDNLNTYSPLSPIFKFGFDSYQNLPYIQFPDDIVEMVGNGLNVRYFETDGANGNVVAKDLNTLKEPSESALFYYDSNNEQLSELAPIKDEETGTTLLTVLNYYAATNGENPETIDEAIANYDKVIGTFNTLITCRDYANWLYRQKDALTNEPLISNIQVSDRRYDINYSIPIVSYNDYGITTSYNFLQVNGESAITPFDLVLYPLKHLSSLTKDANYKETFTPEDNVNDLISYLEDSQCVAHTYLDINNGNINFLFGKYLIKNYYRLNAKISTTYKVNDVERAEIIGNVKKALYDNFNSRMVDYGEEIPYELLLRVIEGADERIKLVNLDEPVQTTWVLPNKVSGDVGNKVEYALLDDTNDNTYYYLDMVARNVLDGRVSLFDYDEDYNYEYGQTSLAKFDNMYSINPKLTITGQGDDSIISHILQENQVVQLIAPNFNDALVATVGVNFKLVLGSGTQIEANTEYLLGVDDKLYLSSTDSNDVTSIYEYGYNYIKTYNANGVLLTTDNVEENVIKPSFVLKTNYGTSRYEHTINDMSYYTLTAQESITIMKRAKVRLDANSLPSIKCYWFMNNPENQLFDTSDTSETSWDVILGENEYFIYTDTTMASLEVFGSGTRLTTSIQSSWKISKKDLVPLDTFNETNASTFSNINWKQINFTTGQYIDVEELKYLTLIEGDSFTITNSTLNSINNEFVDMDGDFIYSNADGKNQTLPTSVAGVYWKIRTRLDLNLGPNLPQQIKGVNNVSPNSNFYEVFDIEYYVYSGGTKTKESESLSALTIDNMFLLLNKNIQRTGSNITYLYATLDDKGDEIDNYPCSLLKYVYSDVPHYIDVDGNSQDLIFDDNNFTNVNVKDLKVTLSKGTINLTSVPVILNEDSYVFVYWGNNTKVTKVDYSATPSPSSVPLTTINLNTNSTSLQPGVNIIKLSANANNDDADIVEVSFKLEVSIDASKVDEFSSTSTYDVGDMVSYNGSVYECIREISEAGSWDNDDWELFTLASSQDAITIEQPKVSLGYNPIFKLSSGDITKLNGVINELINTGSESNQFYYTNSIVNTRALEDTDKDVGLKSPYVLWDKNNVYNKFTIAEIDFDESSIDVIKSSRVA